MASPAVTPSGELSHQDILELQEIAQRLPKGDPRGAKVAKLLSSQPTEFEKENAPKLSDFASGLGKTLLRNNPVTIGQSAMGNGGAIGESTQPHEFRWQDAKPSVKNLLQNTADEFTHALGAGSTPLERTGSAIGNAYLLGASSHPASKDSVIGAGRAAIDAVPKVAKSAQAIASPAVKMGMGALEDVPVLRGAIRGARAFRDVPRQVRDIWSPSNKEVATPAPAVEMRPSRLLTSGPRQMPPSSLADDGGPIARPAAKMIQRDSNTGKMRASYLSRTAEPNEGAQYLTPRTAMPSLLEEMYEKAQAADEIGSRSGLPRDEFENRFRTDPVFRNTGYVPVRMRGAEPSFADDLTPQLEKSLEWAKARKK